MAKKPHPSEELDNAIIANAASWTAFQFRGPHDRQKAQCTTREQAITAARAMVADFPSRPAMVYAISAEGRQALAQTVRA
jgi:hypothetical protein